MDIFKKALKKFGINKILKKHKKDKKLEDFYEIFKLFCQQTAILIQQAKNDGEPPEKYLNFMIVYDHIFNKDLRYVIPINKIFEHFKDLEGNLFIITEKTFLPFEYNPKLLTRNVREFFYEVNKINLEDLIKYFEKKIEFSEILFLIYISQLIIIFLKDPKNYNYTEEIDQNIWKEIFNFSPPGNEYFSFNIGDYSYFSNLIFQYFFDNDINKVLHYFGDIKYKYLYYILNNINQTFECIRKFDELKILKLCPMDVFDNFGVHRYIPSKIIFYKSKEELSKLLLYLQQLDLKGLFIKNIKNSYLYTRESIIKWGKTKLFHDLWAKRDEIDLPNSGYSNEFIQLLQEEIIPEINNDIILFDLEENSITPNIQFKELEEKINQLYEDIKGDIKEFLGSTINISSKMNGKDE